MSRAVSFNPETFVSAGLADDFDGEITEVRYVPWDYNGQLSNHILAARVTIQPDEESGYDEFTQHFSAGDLQYFVPSTDGEEAVDLDSDDPEDMEGSFLVQVGTRTSLSRSSNWAQFMMALVEAGFPTSQIGEDVSSLEGLRAHFNRIPQQKRGGIQNTDTEGRQKEILVVTEVLELPAGATKSQRKSSGKSSKSSKTSKTSKTSKANGAPARSGGSNDLDDRIIETVLTALADEEELSKSQLPQFVMKAFDNGKDKATAVKRVTDAVFLSSVDAWTYNADEGTVTIG